MYENLPEVYRHHITQDVYFDMVLVKPGLFLRGSDADDVGEWEKPEHLVRITKPYYIGIHPVTQSIWETVMGSYNPSYFKGANRPVEQVSWVDIVEGRQDEKVLKSFLGLFQQNHPNKDPALTSFTFRLPTEAEWEYAGKGGHLTAFNSEEEIPQAEKIYSKYAGSDQLKGVGWYELNSHQETKDVGKKKPNELGLYDMNGNVWEWCHDWQSDGYYNECKERGVVKDPLGPHRGRFRVRRGGSFRYNAENCQVSFRGAWNPAYRLEDTGFRLVLSPASAGVRYFLIHLV